MKDVWRQAHAAKEKREKDGRAAKTFGQSGLYRGNLVVIKIVILYFAV